ncbi:adenosylmethionine decarboxylase [Thermodesulfobacterium hveragerdense]|uniref:adenosylmethionine decarboxylase n=1 Tax=Thermodesulfobacterium hveragerdense TaxID=53424 RepID=UPI0003F83207|nr:adenosylmethionine decarboxylase [Thermodesulfobacterium hveragerdense]
MSTVQTVCQVERLNTCPTQQGALKRCVWSYHIIAEFWGSPFELLAEAPVVEQALKEALATNGALKEVSAVSYQFQPFGVSAQVNLGCSHIYIHTWPERGYSALDILAENKEKAHKILAKLQRNLRPQNVYIAEFARGLSQDTLSEGGET